VPHWITFVNLLGLLNINERVQFYEHRLSAGSCQTSLLECRFSPPD
jgi:hypothetical protein